MSSVENLQLAFGVTDDDAPYTLDALHRRHGSWLLAFLRRRFNSQDAEDLAQDTYVRVAGAHTEIRNPRAFLAKVAINAARDRARAAAVRPTLSPIEECQGPETASDQAEALLLKQIILGLPPACRAVFLLSRYGGLTQPEIARRLGVSLRSVERNMTKAVTLCTARLQA